MIITIKTKTQMRELSRLVLLRATLCLEVLPVECRRLLYTEGAAREVFPGYIKTTDSPQQEKHIVELMKPGAELVPALPIQSREH